MTKVKIPGGTSVLLPGNQVPSLSQVLSVNNDGGAQQIKNIGDPTNNQDVVTLAYFNSHSAGAVSSVSGTLNQITVSPTTGAVVISLPNSVVFPGVWSIGTLGYSDTGILWSAQSSTNSYNQVIVQNTNNGNAASTNFNVSNDQGTATTNFGEFGINSSGFTGTSSFSVAGNVYLASGSTDLVIGTYANKTLRFVTNSSTTDNLSITGAGVFTYTVPINGSIFTSTWTATANNQSAFEWNGTITSRNTASDTFNYLVIDPTLARNAGNPASQVAIALLVNPTFSNSPSGFLAIFTSKTGIGTVAALTNGNLIADLFNVVGGNFRVVPGINSGGILLSDSSITRTAFFAASTIAGGGGYSIYANSAVQFDFGTNATQRMSITGSTGNILIGSTNDNARLYILQSALSSSQIPGFRLDIGAHTAIIAGSSYQGFINNTVTLTWANGSSTIATQSLAWFKAPTYNAGTGNTITDAVNVQFDDPIAGTGTVTNLYSVLGSKAKFTGNRFLLTGLPTSSAGLPTGALWNNSNVINIVP